MCDTEYSLAWKFWLIWNARKGRKACCWKESWCILALTSPFKRSRGPTLAAENMFQTMTLPPPNLTDFLTHFDSDVTDITAAVGEVSYRQSLKPAIVPWTCFTWKSEFFRWVEWVGVIMQLQNSRYCTLLTAHISSNDRKRQSSTLHLNDLASEGFSCLGVARHLAKVVGQWSKAVTWPCWEMLPHIISRKKQPLLRLSSYFDLTVFINLRRYSNYVRIWWSGEKTIVLSFSRYCVYGVSNKHSKRFRNKNTFQDIYYIKEYKNELNLWTNAVSIHLNEKYHKLTELTIHLHRGTINL